MQIINFKIERDLLVISIFQHEYKLTIPFYSYVVNGKNYGLNSGERQTGKNLKQIRKDHINRYKMVINTIKDFFNKDAELKIADIFCGNGYGSYLICSELNNAKCLSIDGCKPAIKLAQKYYANKNINYLHKLFPFTLRENHYDVVVSLESIEHILNDDLFFKLLVSILKKDGILFISTPNTNKYIREVNNDGWHIRHYSNEAIRALAKYYGLDLIKYYGQDCYIFDENGIIKDLLPEEKMNLKLNSEGQFQIFVLKKNN